MRTRHIGRAAVIALFGAAFASACAAQDNNAPMHTQMVRIGQSNVLIEMPDTTPAPVSYALTGEQNHNQRSLAAWQKQAGPVYTFGNGSIVTSPSK